MRFLIPLLALLLPVSAGAACLPSNAPTYSVGCQPLAVSPSLSDYFLAWQPGLFPASSRLMSFSQLQTLLAGTGTVTSVGLSGGTTGLTFAGSPITTSGTITVGGTLGVANGGTGQSTYTDGQLLIGDSSTGGLDRATLTAGSNVTITNGHGTITIAASGGGGSGTVTSVGLSMPSIFSVSGSPITTSGTLSAALASQVASVVFAGPTSGSGSPTFRSLVVGDLPGSGATTVNGTPCTLGSTCTVTGAPSGTASGDLSGSYPGPTVAKVNGANVPASATVLGSNSSSQIVAASTTGTGSAVLAASPTISGSLTLSGVTGSVQCLQASSAGVVSGTGSGCGGGGGSGTVTSVGLSGGTSGLTFAGSPITTSGTITVGGTLVVANGGTGAATLTAHGVLIGEGTGAVVPTSAGTAGYVLTSNGASADPTWQSLGTSFGGTNGPVWVDGSGTPFVATSTDITPTIGTGSGSYVVSAVNGKAITLGGSLTTSGASALTLTTTAATNVTLPTSGTLLATTGNGGSLTGLAYSQLPAIAANQVLGALTATTPSGLTMPSCSAANDALIWTSGTGFGCNTAVGDITGVTAGTGLTGGGTSGTVTLSLATISNNTILGNVSGSTGTPTALNATQATTLCNTVTASLSGCAPASGGGTTNFLRADGTWAAPSGGSSTVLRGALAGMLLNDNSTTSISVTGGQAADSSAAAYITLASTFYKSTAGAWTAGAGSTGSPVNGMGNGLTIAASTWYHVCAAIISGSADVFFDTSPTCANAPAGTTSTRRIGSFETDGSSHVIAFTEQIAGASERFFFWATQTQDYAATVTSASRQLIALNVPSGVNVRPIGRVIDQGVDRLFVTSPAETDVAPGAATAAPGNDNIGTNWVIPMAGTYITDTSQHLGFRSQAATATDYIYTRGWIDSCGVGQ